MTGKNNEKYMDEGLYKYNNSFQKDPDPFCRQKLHVARSYMSSDATRRQKLHVVRLDMSS